MLNLRTVAIQSSLFIEVGSTYRRVVLSAKKIKIVVVLNIITRISRAHLYMLEL